MMEMMVEVLQMLLNIFLTLYKVGTDSAVVVNGFGGSAYGELRVNI